MFLDEHVNAHRNVHLVNLNVHLNVLEELELEFELFNYYFVGWVVVSKNKIKTYLNLS